MKPTEHFGTYFGYIRRLFQSWVSPFKAMGRTFVFVGEREMCTYKAKIWHAAYWAAQHGTIPGEKLPLKADYFWAGLLV